MDGLVRIEAEETVFRRRLGVTVIESEGKLQGSRATQLRSDKHPSNVREHGYLMAMSRVASTVAIGSRRNPGRLSFIETIGIPSIRGDPRHLCPRVLNDQLADFD